MAERYLSVKVVREQEAVVVLRVDDARTQLHRLPLQGPDRVAVTERIRLMAERAAEACGPEWADTGRRYYGPADVAGEGRGRHEGLHVDGGGPQCDPPPSC